ncbi:hypothetical protein BV898_16342 [Hypsibius exemplaris]|uniref:Uncharacterized protein n=1 Tax=Hypsibius exemplaris TaxID=2072580 RepID=A0A9X6NK31_HYPEX|nr:hypothetical protein BV898_16342 [Hypsibius exemplaris]
MGMWICYYLVFGFSTVKNSIPNSRLNLHQIFGCTCFVFDVNSTQVLTLHFLDGNRLSAEANRGVRYLNFMTPTA